MNTDPQKVEALFERALTFPAAQRTAFLAGACADDKPLRERVEALLTAHESRVSFLPAGPTEGSATVLAAERVTEGVGSVIGRYKLLEPLGEGGFGVVWAAEQREPVRRRVALKVIKLGMDTRQVVARFEAERQALALMDHPNIARVLDAGATDTGRPYFVMELVRGIPITRYCSQERLHTQGRLELFIQVCQAIQHAHQKGIIHRDIKPSNILVTLHDGVPVPKVIDFGIAKATQAQLTDKTIYTQFHQFIGTPAYMSPEQTEMSGLDIDTRSDIYSLGVLLYELLSGSTPFDTKELMQAGLDEMRRIIREQEPVRPSTRLNRTRDQARGEAGTESAFANPRSTIDPDLDWVVMKCLEKDRARRYETANGVAADIRRHLNSEPVVARPPTASYRFRKMVRRHKLAFSAGSVVFVCLWLTATVIPYQAMRAIRAQQAAVRAATAEQQQRLIAVQKEAEAKASAQHAQRHLYAADMNLARRLWDLNEVDQLWDLLGQTASYAERGFEWYYWQRQLRQDRQTMRGYAGGLAAVGVARGGQQVLSCEQDQTVRVRELAGGREVFSFKGDEEPVQIAAFSPDASRLLVVDRLGGATVQSVALKQRLSTLQGSSGNLLCAGFSWDGERLVVGTAEDGLQVFESSSGRLVWNARQKDSHAVATSTSGAVEAAVAVAFAPDGRAIAAGDDSGRVWIVDAASGQSLLRLKGPASPIRCVSYSPDGQKLVAATEDGALRIWEMPAGRELTTVSPEERGTGSVGFSPDGSRLVGGEWDGKLRVWEVASGRELFTLQGHSDAIFFAAYAPDGRQIVSAGRDQAVKVWGTEPPLQVRRIESHDGPVRCVAASPDGLRAVTGHWDGTARVWELARDSEAVVVKPSQSEVNCVGWTADGRWILAGSGDGTTLVWDANGMKDVLTLSARTTGQDIFVARDGIAFKRDKNLVESVVVSPGRKRILTGHCSGELVMWDALDGRQLLVWKGHESSVRTVAFSPDGQKALTAGNEGMVRVWESSTGRELLTLKGHRGPVSGAAFSPDGSRIVSAGYDQALWLWDAATGQQLQAFKGHVGLLNSPGFSPDGQRIVAASGSSQGVLLWDVQTGRELLSFRDLPGGIVSVSFSGNGRRIVVGTDQALGVMEAATDDQVKLWRNEQPPSPTGELLHFRSR